MGLGSIGKIADVATLGGVSATTGFGMLGGPDGSGAAGRASAQQMAAIGKAQNYLGDYYEPRQALQQDAQSQLAGFYGLNGGDPNAANGMYNQVMQGPQYQHMIQQGDDAVLRNASATGGMRSGNAQVDLAQQSQNVMGGLMNQRLQGLQGFNSMETGEGKLADLMMQKGGVQAQGTMAAAQAKQDQWSNMMGLGMGAAQMAFGMPPTAPAAASGGGLFG